MSNSDTQTRNILALVLRHRRMLSGSDTCAGPYCPVCAAAQADRVAGHVRAVRPIHFILPAFPGKSPNHAKVLGPLPDRAEELALDFLNSLAERIANIYPTGARITICSDGRVFSDQVLIPDEHIDTYQIELRTMIQQRGHAHLDFFNLDDVYPGLDYTAMRDALTMKYAPTLDVLREDVRGGGQALQLYRGITRFLYEDACGGNYNGSNAALQRDCRRRAYAVIQRSQAWTNLLADHFPDAVRLSIHPQPCGASKLGIQLVEVRDNWLTPWHGVAVEHDGTFQLMKRRAAEELDAHLTFSQGRPSYFRIPIARGATNVRHRQSSPVHREKGNPPMTYDMTAQKHTATTAASSDPRWSLEPLDPFGLLITAYSEDTTVQAFGTDRLRELARQHHVVALRGFTTFSTAHQLETYARRLGAPMKWPFGAVLELVEHEDPTDSVFGNGFLPFHWDGMYVSHIPEFQLFHCLAAPGQEDGGRTIFADTTRMLANATTDQRGEWEVVTITYRINQAVHYGGQACSPLVVPHPMNGSPTMRFNEPMPAGTVNKSDLTVEGIDPLSAERVLKEVTASLHHPQHQYRHQWQGGDIVITNNYVLLHTREAYRSHAPRHLRRIHILGNPPFENPAIAKP